MVQIQEKIRKTQFQVCKKSLRWFASLLLYEHKKKAITRNNMKWWKVFFILVLKKYGLNN